ncbi:unnamed protein product [Gordionus sp. m RMFG-2023]
MSRHKNFRGKKFEAEEDDYDDDYDDYEYSVSPDASNDFLNPQSIKIPLSSFEKHPVIADKTPENDTCLNSCLDSIKDLIGDAVSDNIIKNEIIKCKYDIEMTLDHLLQNQTLKKGNPIIATDGNNNKILKNKPVLIQKFSSIIDNKSKIPLLSQSRSPPNKMAPQSLISTNLTKDTLANYLKSNNPPSLPPKDMLDNVSQNKLKTIKFIDKLPSFTSKNFNSSPSNAMKQPIILHTPRANFKPLLPSFSSKRDILFKKDTSAKVETSPKICPTSTNTSHFESRIPVFGEADTPISTKFDENAQKNVDTLEELQITPLKTRISDQRNLSYLNNVHDFNYSDNGTGPNLDSNEPLTDLGNYATTKGEASTFSRILSSPSNNLNSGLSLSKSNMTLSPSNNVPEIFGALNKVDLSNTFIGNIPYELPIKDNDFNHILIPWLLDLLRPNLDKYSYLDPSLNKKGRKNNPKKAPKNENLDRSQLLTSSLDAGMSNLNIVSPIPTTPSKKIGKNPRKEDSKEVKDGSKIAKDLVPEPEKVLNSSPVEYRLDAKELEMLEEAKKCRKMEGNSVINVVTLGHVDAGKSTLIGHLLCLKGNISQRTMHKNEVESKKVGKGSFAYAWVLDETGEERSRGITMDVSHRCLKLKNVTVNLIDSPGHKDFIPNMITGASQADAAILVIDATKGEFETGFLSGGQTREHAILARSLGVSQLIVAVNKMDTLARHNVERFSQILLQMTPFLRQCGFKDSAISFVPVSGLVGTNLIETPKDTDDDIKFLALCRQTGTLVDRLESLNIPERRLDYPLRFVISDSYKSPIGSGFCLFGHLETGFMNIGGIKGSSKNNAKYVILPANEIVTIKNIKLGETDVHLILAGDHVTLTVMGGPELPLKLVSNACQILTPINQPIPLANVILAKILVFDVSSSHDQDKSDGFYNNFTNNCPSIYSPITLGFEAVFHYLSFAEPCVITKLVALIDKSTGEYVTNAIQDGKKPKVKKPKLVSKGESAECEITFSRAICIEPFSSFGCKELGRFTLRQFGRSVCAGIAIKVQQIFIYLND